MGKKVPPHAACRMPTYELHTPRGAKEAEHGSYVVTLVALGPPPASNRQASAEDYVATVRLRRRD